MNLTIELNNNVYLMISNFLTDDKSSKAKTQLSKAEMEVGSGFSGRVRVGFGPGSGRVRAELS